MEKKDTLAFPVEGIHDTWMVAIHDPVASKDRGDDVYYIRCVGAVLCAGRWGCEKEFHDYLTGQCIKQMFVGMYYEENDFPFDLEWHGLHTRNEVLEIIPDFSEAVKSAMQVAIRCKRAS